MAFQVLNTQDWSFDRLAPYTKDITAAMHKLAERFPYDVDVPTLANEIMSGHRVLWLILDADNRFVSFCLTCTTVASGTNTKIVTLTSHAGAEGLACVPDMCRVIEEYAAEQGADMSAAEGRRGWARELAKHGYEEYCVVFRKRLRAENG